MSSTDKEFFQEGPVLKNQFTQDPLLKRYLKKKLPSEIYNEISKSLNELGALAAGDMLAWADDAEKNPPKLLSYDPWSRRVDEIQLAPGWKKIEGVATVFGIVASGYERTYQQHSRLYQMAMLYLFHPSSAFVSCPLAMTDGAARAIELYGDETLKATAFKRLTSRDPKTNWTSGQWMTEKTGGSDVSGTSTMARKVGNSYQLFGVKSFTSATAAPMAMTLARTEGAEAGSRGLSLFYLETKNAEGGLNDIRIHRLKDKLGTRALPTAELSLEGTPAQLVGGEGHGVRKISSLFNITRIYNAICSIGQMRRAIELATEYARIRSAFGARLIDHPLHRLTLSDMQLEWMGCFHLTMKAVEILGKEECKKATDLEYSLLRVLTPLAKLYCGKAVVSVCSEAVECFGGAGYMEDTGIPKLLRDAQTLSIWEGTTNVLSLDMLRAFEKENGLAAIKTDLAARIKALRNLEWQKTLVGALSQLSGNFEAAKKLGTESVTGNARGFAMTLTRIYIGSLLCEFAESTNEAMDIMAAKHWLQKRALKFDLNDIQECLI